MRTAEPGGQPQNAEKEGAARPIEAGKPQRRVPLGSPGVPARSPSHVAQNVVALQRLAGNAAVQRFIANLQPRRPHRGPPGVRPRDQRCPVAQGVSEASREQSAELASVSRAANAWSPPKEPPTIRAESSAGR